MPSFLGKANLRIKLTEGDKQILSIMPTSNQYLDRSYHENAYRFLLITGYGMGELCLKYFSGKGTRLNHYPGQQIYFE